MRHIPNILSAFRLVLIPFFIWQMLDGNTLAGGIILLVSALTDMLDGFLARKFNWVSDLGKVLDPIADKATQLAVYIVMLITLRQYWPFFIVMLAKEVIMLCGGAYLLKKRIKLEGAHWFGKIATILFFAVMIILILFPQLPNSVAIIMLSVATVSSVGALLMYIPEFFAYKQQARKK